MPTDFELLERWRSGDKQSGNALFERHFKSLYRFFRNKVEDEAEDLIQDTFLACLRSSEGFLGHSSFRTYLFRAAHSKLYDHLRKKYRHAGRIDFSVSSIVDLGMSPRSEIIHKNEQALLLAGMQNLPVDLQVALELFYFEQLPGPELAEVLGVPEGTVRSRLRRARELLRQYVAEPGREFEDLEFSDPE